MNLFQLFEANELVTELLWFQRYITEHDLKTQVEIDNNKLLILMPSCKKLRWDVIKANNIRTKTLCHASPCHLYAQFVLKSRFELGEPIIATEAEQSYYYAVYVLHGRFELGEKVISTNAVYYQKYQDFVATLKNK